MKKEIPGKNITRVIRGIFFTAFAVLVCFGLAPEDKNKGYVPTEISAPVFSHVVEADSFRGNDTVTDVFVFGGITSVPQNGARSAALISADTGEALYLKNADIPLPMASTTKIMTALTVIQSCDVEDIVTVPAEVCRTEGSSIYLVPGERITVRDLLYGLLLESGNDAAQALAIYCSGSVERFADLMNENARSMGLVNTHFENPHGLSAQGHHTTARELGIMAYHAMKEPLFREIVGTKSYTVKGQNGEDVKYFANHNRLLRTYNGATGIKTGYTLASGRCLVTSAVRDGSEFIAVTLDDRQDFADHAAMLDFAFDSYRTVTLCEDGEIFGFFGGMRYENISDMSVICEKDGEKSFTYEMTLTPFEWEE